MIKCGGKMKILFYRYNSICEPDIIDAFCSIGLEVIEETAEMKNKNLLPSEQVKIVSQAIENNEPLLVFSVNFFPAIADVCHIFHIPYVCWIVDCPVLELFSPSIKHNTNCIFLFDYDQYLYFSRFNPECIHYLTLASAVERFDKTLTIPISTDGSKKIDYDISFVGSLYSEKNNMNKLIKELPEYIKGYVAGITEASLKVYGANFIEECLDKKIINAIKEASEDFYEPKESVINSEAYVVANDYIGIQATEQERINNLNLLAQFYNVDLFTRSDTSPLKNVHIHGGVNTLTEMPYIFRNSKINLNFTSKSIHTGIPLRIFDIMGCGGFVMTNYQAELSDYFDIGVDLEAYSSVEELVEKCGFYLKHDDERKKIALRGYEKVRNEHRYIYKVETMIKEALNVAEKFS